MITLQDVRSNEDIAGLIDATNQALEVLGYTEHGLRHVGYVSHTAEQILRELGYPERRCQLAARWSWAPLPGGFMTWETASIGTTMGLLGAPCSFPFFEGWECLWKR